MKLAKISVLVLLMAFGSTSPMQLNPKHPFEWLNPLLAVETKIYAMIGASSDLYESAQKVVEYISFQVLLKKLTIKDAHELKEIAFRTLADKYLGMYQELIDVKLNIFKLKYF